MQNLNDILKKTNTIKYWIEVLGFSDPRLFRTDIHDALNILVAQKLAAPNSKRNNKLLEAMLCEISQCNVAVILESRLIANSKETILKQIAEIDDVNAIKSLYKVEDLRQVTFDLTPLNVDEQFLFNEQIKLAKTIEAEQSKLNKPDLDEDKSTTLFLESTSNNRYRH